VASQGRGSRVAVAQLDLGRLYEDGAAGSPDCAEAASGSAVLLSSQSPNGADWTRQEALRAFRRTRYHRSTSRRAQARLGLLLMHGKGVLRDRAEAAKWFR